jgi:L-alanine-DL-glutamate epimerase-like enolase superfamily enzyme
MRIRKLTAHVARLPLKRLFKHASASRHQSDNVLICCELEDGSTGWGEGVPRSYVTGEMPDGCLAQLAATPIADQLSRDCSSWPDVIKLCEQFQPAVDRQDPRGCYGNALRCAVELSVLDAYGRLFGEPISRAAGHYASAQPILAQSAAVRYSAAIDSDNRGLVRKSLIRRAYGFRHCKVKVGAAGDDDVARLQTIRRWIGSRMDLRLDANEAWTAPDAHANIEALLKYGISCIEQPVPHEEVGKLAELRKNIAVPIMFDESLTSIIDAQAAIDGRTCDLFNIRLSKCGGFFASLQLAAMATAAGLGFQLGCHPGESGILSAAGRHWACSVQGIRYLEGSYDRHLLQKLLTNEDITFGYGGLAPALNGRGLGVTVDKTVLEQVTLSRQEYALG